MEAGKEVEVTVAAVNKDKRRLKVPSEHSEDGWAWHKYDEVTLKEKKLTKSQTKPKSLRASKEQSQSRCEKLLASAKFWWCCAIFGGFVIAAVWGGCLYSMMMKQG